MSIKSYKKFPIVTDTACQLKWTHSTVFLTMLTTASCHRVEHNKFDLDTFDFHNTTEKIRDRNMMLEGKWPGHGCEHCKHIEDAGGTSDRMLHLDFHGIHAPPELDVFPTATHVTPRILEIYFSNTCNLKCIYCIPHFSSQINDENRKHGGFMKNDVWIEPYREIPTEFDLATDKMFDWLDMNIQYLTKLFILGGEPFIQKETKRLLDFLETKRLPNLDLVFSSNLTIPHDKFVAYMEKLKRIEQTSELHQIQITASLDCWGEEAEYVRKNLDLKLFEKNFEYLLSNTNFVLNINSALTALSVPTMPDLARKINEWSRKRIVYWSMMKTGGKPYMHPSIFGPVIMDLGFQAAIDAFEVMDDPEKRSYKDYFVGIGKELSACTADPVLQRHLKTYLVELDRRRGTDYTKTFPSIARLMESIPI